jgi:hypothetical protein
MSEPPHCSVVSSFIARQAIIGVAGILFLVYTYLRVRLGYERRNLATFVADVSKQGGQQAFGGVLMVVLGVLLAEGGLDSLAWYGAEYPFEIVLTTMATSWLRTGSERFFLWLQRRTSWACLEPFNHFGQYGPTPGSFLCSWYWAQMFQAVLIIGVFARLFSVLCIVLSLAVMPEWCSPVLLVGRAWFYSGLTCAQRTVLTLYVMPVLGDAVQFVIIDHIQKFRSQADQGYASDEQSLVGVQVSSSQSSPGRLIL